MFNPAAPVARRWCPDSALTYNCSSRDCSPRWRPGGIPERSRHQTYERTVRRLDRRLLPPRISPFPIRSCGIIIRFVIHVQISLLIRITGTPTDIRAGGLYTEGLNCGDVKGARSGAEVLPAMVGCAFRNLTPASHLPSIPGAMFAHVLRPILVSRIDDLRIQVERGFSGEATGIAFDSQPPSLTFWSTFESAFSLKWGTSSRQEFSRVRRDRYLDDSVGILIWPPQSAGQRRRYFD